LVGPSSFWSGFDLFQDSWQLLNNTTWEGSNGTWTSSNPLVMSVNQQGLAFATTGGTAIIRYTPPNGLKFSEWIMYVQAP
jgi:uncharacterized protein YjdB